MHPTDFTLAGALAAASVFASLITVNINAAVMMTAERAADCILADGLS